MTVHDAEIKRLSRNAFTQTYPEALLPTLGCANALSPGISTPEL